MNSELAKPRQKIGNIKDLEHLTGELVTLTIPFNGGEIDLDVRRLTPNESWALRSILHQVRPPQLGKPECDHYGNTLEKPVFDFDDPHYRFMREGCRREVRARGIYMACPAFYVEGLKENDIPMHVQRLLSDAALESVWRVISEGCEGLK